MDDRGSFGNDGVPMASAGWTAGPHSVQLKPTEFPLKHGVLDRLRCIEVVARWEGSINAASLTNWYGISRKQATQDLTYYREKNPGAIEYNRSLKQFEITSRFRPIFCDASELDYLQHLKRCESLNKGMVGVSLESPGIDVSAYPAPRLSLPLYRFLLRAIRSNSTIQCRYLEKKEDSEHLSYTQLCISPLKLVNTHVGWYLRAYNHDTMAFSMLLLNRIYGEPSRLWEKRRVPEDTDWNRKVRLIGETRRDLPKADVELTIADWGMQDGKALVVSARKCLVGIVLYYWKAVDSRLAFRVIDSASENWLKDMSEDAG